MKFTIKKELTGTFEKVSYRYTSTNYFKIGDVIIAEYRYDGTRAKNDPKKYILTTHVKGLKEVIGHYETEQECKDMCEKIGLFYIKMLEK